MAPPSATPAPLARALSRGRAAADPRCAGCAQLGLFRALRRAGLDVQGGSGCEPDGDRAFATAPGRWAAVSGARRVLAGAGRLVREADGAGARVLVVADRAGPRGQRAAALLAASGARVARLELSDAARAEAEVRAAAAPGGPPVALVALSPCTRGAPRRPPLAVAASRCNRCGACLSLGCPALSDVGAEAMAIDPAICTGCDACSALCRAGALRRP